jgi:hypothetical protein
MPTAFRHLPVTALLDVTHNFEQLLPEAFKPVAFEHNWTNFSEVFQQASYMKDPFGFVHVRGLIKSGQSGKSAFILPVGYLPLANAQYPVYDGAGAAGVIAVEKDGKVVPTGNNAAIRWGEITYLAEA